MFDNRVQKIVSLVAADATLEFIRQALTLIVETSSPALFDARVFNAPSLDSVVSNLAWREADAVKNSISMAAQSVYPHKQLLNKNSEEKQELLFQKGINWNDYPLACKRGSWFTINRVERKFNTDEINQLPPKHAARTNPELTFVRNEVIELYHKSVQSFSVEQLVNLIFGE
jgi:tRNA(His) 5'-end guanylyltransferase